MKHCEFCGVESNDYFFRFIAEQMNIIFLNNPQITYNDKEQRVVVLKNGERLDYSWQIDPNVAINFMDLSVHIFCSERCEDAYIAKYPVIFRPDIANDVVMINWQEEKIFNPQVFPTKFFIPEFMWESCDVCSIKFPSTKSYSYIVKNKVSKITKCDIISGMYGAKASQVDNYDITVSDFNEEITEGKYFMYKSNVESYFEKQFCSKECTFNYCRNNESISISKNNLENGSLTVVTPHTLDINKKLGNNFIYRPHILPNV